MRTAANVPTVFITAFADAEVLQAATDVEPYGYVVKPFAERDLVATITVALRRRQAEDRSLSMERWLAMTLGSIGDAVIATDVDGRITFFNATAEMLTGWTRAEALGRELGEVFVVGHEGADDPFANLFERVSTSGVIFHLTRGFELGRAPGYGSRSMTASRPSAAVTTPSKAWWPSSAIARA